MSEGTHVLSLHAFLDETDTNSLFTVIWYCSIYLNLVRSNSYREEYEFPMHCLIRFTINCSYRAPSSNANRV